MGAPDRGKSVCGGKRRRCIEGCDGTHRVGPCVGERESRSVQVCVSERDKLAACCPWEKASVPYWDPPSGPWNLSSIHCMPLASSQSTLLPF